MKFIKKITPFFIATISFNLGAHAASLDQVANTELAAPLVSVETKSEQKKINPTTTRSPKVDRQTIAILQQKNEYVPIKARSYDYVFNIGLEQKSFQGRPQKAILGAQNLNEIGSFFSTEMQFGLSQFFSTQVRGSLAAYGQYGVVDYQNKTASGQTLKPRIHMVGYGFTANLAYFFKPTWGAQFSYLQGPLQLNQSASQSSFADWTEKGLQTVSRLGFFYEFKQTDLNWDLALHLQQQKFLEASIDFSKDINWLISTGARW